MRARTISEQILSAKAGRDARAGDTIVCTVDLIVGTDASSPMAIDYFEQMGATSVADASKVVFALDHYSPPANDATRRLHDRVRAFSRAHGIELYEVGEGISHQIIAERGRVGPGDLVIGADSHTVTCGALNLFATGIGSSDLAAAMMTGQIWLRVPETIRVELVGERASGLSAKDVALAMVGDLGAEGASYETLEFHGDGVAQLSMDERMVLSNLAVEAGAKAAIFPWDETLAEYVARHDGGRVFRPGMYVGSEDPTSISSDVGASFSQTLTLRLDRLSPRIALPHQPDHVRPLADAAGIPVHMVFIGTCTGGRASDIRAALQTIEQRGGRIAPGVKLVVTPASRAVQDELAGDGSLRRLHEIGATITMPGCGACCGTSGVIPTDGMNVLSTANRNFKARMGNATASIYLASPEACGAAAVAGQIVAQERP